MTPIQEKYRDLHNKYEQWQLGREEFGGEQSTPCGRGKFLSLPKPLS